VRGLGGGGRRELRPGEAEARVGQCATRVAGLEGQGGACVLDLAAGVLERGARRGNVHGGRRRARTREKQRPLI
jgi:hypothetical protein